jgi:hypothetical protein
VRHPTSLIDERAAGFEQGLDDLLPGTRVFQLRSERESELDPDAVVGQVPLAEEFAFGLELMITGLRHS